MFPRKVLPDGQVAEVMPLIGGRGRIIVGDGRFSVERSW